MNRQPALTAQNFSMIEFIAYSSGSHGNLYKVSDGKTALLLEAGLSVREIKKCLDFKLSSIDACLCTHEHKDHSKGVPDLMKAGIDCYMSAGTAHALDANINGHRLHRLIAKKQIQIGTWTVLPFETIHDAEEPLGFLLVNRDGEKLLFATDTHYLPYKFNKLTHIAIECNFEPETLKHNVVSGQVPPEVGKRLWSRHMSFNQVQNFLQANDLSRVQSICLLHLSGDNSDPEGFEKEIERQTGIPTYIA